MEHTFRSQSLYSLRITTKHFCSYNSSTTVPNQNTSILEFWTQMTNPEPTCSAVSAGHQQGLVYQLTGYCMTGPLQHLQDTSQHQLNELY